VWWETVRRVVEGTYRMQERHIKAHNLGWDAKKAQTSAQEMFDRMFCMKFLPPGRGLWAMGSELTEERGIFAALNNCGFRRSTARIDEEGAAPFCWLMDASMLGIGVGFDVKGAGLVEIKQAGMILVGDSYTIPDTREGWVESVRILINAFLNGTRLPWFDYSQIRPAGEHRRSKGSAASPVAPIRSWNCTDASCASWKPTSAGRSRRPPSSTS
jgi:ribonucleoside-triphosphate reductase